MKRGILIGLDEKIEWLLPWWWSNYSKHNDFPVIFIDFGMSSKACRFCSERGELIPLNSSLKISKARVQKWQSIYGKELWQSRSSWFKKPFALLKTSYEQTIWLDLDCEVLTHLEELFHYCEGEADVALARETESSFLHEKNQGLLLDGEILYNSGVIVYKKNAPLIHAWSQGAEKNNREFWGDEQLLSRLIFQNSYKIQELSAIYNWRISEGFNMHAAIIHWAGSWGKEYIRRYGGLGHELEKLPKI